MSSSTNTPSSSGTSGTTTPHPLIAPILDTDSDGTSVQRAIISSGIRQSPNAAEHVYVIHHPLKDRWILITPDEARQYAPLGTPIYNLYNMSLMHEEDWAELLPMENEAKEKKQGALGVSERLAARLRELERIVEEKEEDGDVDEEGYEGEVDKTPTPASAKKREMQGNWRRRGAGGAA